MLAAAESGLNISFWKSCLSYLTEVLSASLSKDRELLSSSNCSHPKRFMSMQTWFSELLHGYVCVSTRTVLQEVTLTASEMGLLTVSRLVTTTTTTTT